MYPKGQMQSTCLNLQPYEKEASNIAKRSKEPNMQENAVYDQRKYILSEDPFISVQRLILHTKPGLC